MWVKHSRTLEGMCHTIQGHWKVCATPSKDTGRYVPHHPRTLVGMCHAIHSDIMCLQACIKRLLAEINVEGIIIVPLCIIYPHNYVALIPANFNL